MRKAYDSISLEGLRLALNRIALPAQFVSWIIELFTNRSMNVITNFGLSPILIAKDGIDQGDAISPLLWRIFYDPLLSAIQSNQSKRGYLMNLSWPSNVTDVNTWTSHSAQIPIMAYMDDTIFIDSSKKRIQSSIDLATEFYDINDIFINGNKCD